MKLLGFAGAAAALMLCTPAFAADEACSDGHWAVVRTSQIKPGGSMAGFAKAIADHSKWYADHGYPADTFGWARVLEKDAKTGQMVPSKDMVMTYHWHSSDVPKAKHDAAWDAYVAEYAANSTIVDTKVVCMAD